MEELRKLKNETEKRNEESSAAIVTGMKIKIFLLSLSFPVCFHLSTQMRLKGPSQPHLCFCLHARDWLLFFIRSISRRRKSLLNY